MVSLLYHGAAACNGFLGRLSGAAGTIFRAYMISDYTGYIGLEDRCSKVDQDRICNQC